MPNELHVALPKLVAIDHVFVFLLFHRLFQLLCFLVELRKRVAIDHKRSLLDFNRDLSLSLWPDKWLGCFEGCSVFQLSQVQFKVQHCLVWHSIWTLFYQVAHVIWVPYKLKIHFRKVLNATSAFKSLNRLQFLTQSFINAKSVTIFVCELFPVFFETLLRKILFFLLSLLIFNLKALLPSSNIFFIKAGYSILNFYLSFLYKRTSQHTLPSLRFIIVCHVPKCWKKIYIVISKLFLSV